MLESLKKKINIAVNNNNIGNVSNWKLFAKGIR
jgi:hypothetical protein